MATNFIDPDQYLPPETWKWCAEQLEAYQIPYPIPSETVSITFKEAKIRETVYFCVYYILQVLIKEHFMARNYQLSLGKLASLIGVYN